MASSVRLPLYGPKLSSASSMGSNTRMPEYVRRFFHLPQMDIDYTLWQMLNLCVAPNRVYRTTKYHKQTKNQWARDDPAFVAIMAIFMAGAAVGYSVAFHATPLATLRSAVFAVVVYFALVGVIAASLCWHIANTYLLAAPSNHTTGQTVEWLYAVDVHCNGAFPFFMLLQVVQFFLLPLLLRDGVASCIFGNALHAVAFSAYFYITFLGYDVLPFLQHTTVFLYPTTAVAVAAIVCTIARFNICQHVMRAHFG